MKKVSKRKRLGRSIEHRRLWLHYPVHLVSQPIMWRLGNKFGLVTDCRHASITSGVGLVCLELSGPPRNIHRAIEWLVASGIEVKPIEITVLEG